MKIMSLVVLLTTIAGAPGAVLAGENVQQTGKTGLGIALGYPANGVSINHFTGQLTSIQANFSFFLTPDRSGFGGRLDLLWWQSKLMLTEYGDLGWFFGPGGNLWASDRFDDGHPDRGLELELAAEFPVGIGFQFSGAPIDLNIEAVPMLQLIHEGGVGIFLAAAAVLNARYYF